MNTRVTDLLGIRVPVIQGAMARIADGKLAGAVSAAGGLGIIACGGAPLAWIEEQVRIAREIAGDAPLGANVMLMDPQAPQVAELLTKLRVDVVTTGAGSPANFMPAWKEAGIKVVPVVASSALAARMERMGADAVVAEGCEAGGHIGELTTMALVPSVCDAVRIPVIAAGGVFTGTDGVRMITEAGADGIQAATRFAVTRESGLPDAVKQRYFDARAEDIEVNGISPTGYPMRMLKSSPAINAALKPQCAAYGYMLDHGGCAYLRAWREAEAAGTAQDGIREKTCLCAQMRSSRVWTLGANGARLAEAGKRDASGRWVLPSTAEVFDDYRFGVADEVHARRDGCGS